MALAMRCQPVRHGRISIQGDDQRYIVHSDELLSAFLDLEATLLLQLLLFVQDFSGQLIEISSKTAAESSVRACCSSDNI
jgi:hypothetical protein